MVAAVKSMVVLLVHCTVLYRSVSVACSSLFDVRCSLTVDGRRCVHSVYLLSTIRMLGRTKMRLDSKNGIGEISFPVLISIGVLSKITHLLTK